MYLVLKGLFQGRNVLSGLIGRQPATTTGVLPTSSGVRSRYLSDGWITLMLVRNLDMIGNFDRWKRRELSSFVGLYKRGTYGRRISQSIRA